MTEPRKSGTMLNPDMMPFFPQEEPKSPKEQARERIATEGRRLKEELSRMTPEERARFWQEIDGTSAERHDPPPPCE